MAKVITPNYTDAQVARINELVAERGANGETAAVLATEFGKTVRSVVAKMVRMDIGYTAKVRTTKSGEPITHKDDLVAEIGRVVEGNLAGLEKAPKAALQALARFVANGE